MADSFVPRLILQAGASLILALGACAAPQPASPTSSTASSATSDNASSHIKSPAGLQQVQYSPKTANPKSDARPGKDFYEYVNGGWLSSYQLPPDKVSAGVAEDLSEKSDQDIRDMIEKIIAANPAPGTTERKIADLYSAAMDEKTIEARGVAPLKPYLDRIRAVKSYDDLMRLMGVIGYNSPIGASVSASPADPDSNAIWVSQAGLGMPHRGYYISTGLQDESTRLGYRVHVANILELIGNSDPRGGATRIYNLERRIAEAHTDEDRSISADEALRTMTLAQLKAWAPGFKWDLFLAEGGLTNSDRIVVTDQTAVADLATLIREVPLDDWKLWMEFHIANEFAEYLPKPFADSYFNFFSKRLAGLEEPPPRWQWAVGIVNNYLGPQVGQLYVKRNFPAGNKVKIDAIVANIRAAFETRMKGLDWMDDKTRSAALAKLAALKPQIGYPDNWEDISGLKIEPGKLVEDVYSVYEFEWSKMSRDLHKPVDRELWPTPAHTINAFYNPLSNTFTMPAGILQAPYFDPDADAAENYGGIGAVIGHEMSHGFDDRGRQFDGAGKNANWWTTQTDARFLAKADTLIQQYDTFCPYLGACVNGLGTLGENIGDLAGLEIAYAAYRLSLKGRDAPLINGLTGDQRFFLAYAKSYRGKVREEVARAMLDGDSHAPNRYRVNGVVRNMDAWYSAFNIKAGDKLYLAPEQRVRIW